MGAIRLEVTAAFALSLAACSVPRSLQQDSLAYNRSLADAQNEMLLLNVARAAKKHPLFLTTATEVSKTVTTKATLGLAVPFGGGSTDSYGAAPGFEVSGQPTIKFAPLDSEKFMKGFLAPVSMDTFGHYLDSGWPKELLLRVFVRGITDPSGRTVIGQPDASDDFRQYREYEKVVLQLANSEISRASDRSKFGPEVSTDSSNPIKLGELVEAAKAGLAVDGTDKKYQVKGKSGDTWSVKVPGQAEGRLYGTDPGPDGKSGKPEWQFLLRSPEDILYHLGQLVRIERATGRPAVLLSNGRPLFTADPARSGCSSCGVSVQYCGQLYAVPGDVEYGESMHVLSLLTQLIGLQKSADELPKSGIVTLIGR